MCRRLPRILKHVSIAIAILLVAALPAAAGDIVLSNNSGGENVEVFITGEPTLVMNGFDLTPRGIDLPAALDAVSISVQAPVVGSAIELVIYQDANGGSPIDGSLVYQQTVQLNQVGINRVVLSSPASITAPVIWVGFYLPVDFHFHADASGPSVLSYMAWTAGSTFDLSALTSAGVLGPANGSVPVSFNMNGIARITAEISAVAIAAEAETAATAVPIGTQLQNQAAQDTSIMRDYADCPGLLYDPEDIEISADGKFSIECALHHEIHGPSYLAQTEDLMLDMQRNGELYRLSEIITEEIGSRKAATDLPLPVTHCIRVASEDLEVAVLAEARGIPESWQVLPSVRFGDLVCAEVTVANYVTYLVPRGPESPPNVNLVMGQVLVDPHPVLCELPTSVQVPVVNTGLAAFDTPITIRVEDVHVASNVITAQRELQIEPRQLEPGARDVIDMGPLYVYRFVGELHRIQVQVDVYNEIAELNEQDNTWFTEYVLSYPRGRSDCGQSSLAWTFDDCKFRFKSKVDEDDRELYIAVDQLEDAVSKPTSDFLGTLVDGLTDEEEKSIAADYIRKQLTAAEWELVTAFFARSRSEIISAAADAIARHDDALEDC